MAAAVRWKIPGGHCHQPAVVIKQRDADFAVQRGVHIEAWLQRGQQPRQLHLRTEHQRRIACWAIPEQQLQLILQETGKRPFARVADDLHELRLGRDDRFIPSFLRGEDAGLGRHQRRRCDADIRAREIDRALRTAPRHATAQIAREERLILPSEHLAFVATGQRRARQRAAERYNKAHIRERPVAAQVIVELQRDCGWLPFAAEGFNMLRKLALLLGNLLLHLLRERIGDALIKQRPLAFEHKLLIAQRTHGQPRQHKARRDNRENEDDGNFPHGWPHHPLAWLKRRAAGSGGFWRVQDKIIRSADL